MVLALTAVILPPMEAEAKGRKTGTGLAQFGMNAYRGGWQYNYGSWGQLTSDKVRLADCSGLIYAYLCWSGRGKNPVADYSWPRGATSQYKACYETGTMKNLPRTHGLLLFNKTSKDNCDHVGIYVGNDKSVDCSDYGVNMRYLTVSQYSDWNAWGKLKGVEYPTDGWYKFDGSPFFYVDGEYVVDDTLTIDGTEYSFDSKGKPSPLPDGYSEGSGTVEGGSSHEGETYYTTADVNLRTGKSTNSNIIRVVSEGTKLSVIDTSDSDWYRVRLSDGTKGYISSDYLSKKEGGSKPAPAVNIPAVTTDYVNLRKSPNMDGAVIDVIPENTKLSIIDTSNSSWYKVKLSDGTTGYIYSSYLKKTSFKSFEAVTTVKAYFRKSPSSKGELIKTIPQGTQVTVIGQKKSWYLVKLSDGSKGYIVNSKLEKGTASSSSSGSTSSSGSSSSKHTAVTTADVNLRSKASTNSTVKCLVSTGTTVEVLSTYSKWVKVKVNNTTGYIYSKYLKCNIRGKTTADVNLRKSPDTSSSVRRVVDKSESLTVICLYSSDWYRVKLRDGTTGYMSADYIKM